MTTVANVAVANTAKGWVAGAPAAERPSGAASELEGRRRVRGGRPEGASVFAAWSPPPAHIDSESRVALEAFERATFAGASPTAVLPRAPEPWMERLGLPGLPIRWNRRTAEYLSYFRDNPEGRVMMRAWVRRAGRYEARIRSIFRDEGVPEDLVLVALAESGFNPRVRSAVGAAGLWQFTENTGAVYGLGQGYWVDDRFDIERSTRAAAMYLKDLKARFGSWELALAAYNAGYGLVLTAIGRHNTNSYWELCEIESGLPFATTNYVPKILAAAIVWHNRSEFGLGDVDALPGIDWVEVGVRRSTSLAAIAKRIDVDTDLLLELNASLIRERTPPRHRGFAIRIPRASLPAFTSARKRVEATSTGERTHLVAHGESLEMIARELSVDRGELRRINRVGDSSEVGGGVVLVVPPADPSASVAPTEAALAAVPPIAIPTGRTRVFYVTTPATTPRVLARVFDVRSDDVVAWNQLDPQARLQAGQVLQLFVPSDFDSRAANARVFRDADVMLVERGSVAHIEEGLRRRGKVRRSYAARRGETLERIGRKFDLTTGDLARINGFGRDHEPAVGERLLVYVDSGRTAGTTDPPARAGPRVLAAEATSESGLPAPIDRLPAPPPRRRPSTADTARIPGNGDP